MSRLKKWDRFAHNGVYAHLQAIVSKVKPMGAEIGSSGDGEITLRWPQGETVYVRRYRKGRRRWRLATNGNKRVMHLIDRDPDISELQTPTN